MENDMYNNPSDYLNYIILALITWLFIKDWALRKAIGLMADTHNKDLDKLERYMNYQQDLEWWEFRENGGGTEYANNEGMKRPEWKG